MAGGGGETAYPVREAPGLTAGQWARVRAFRSGHRLAAAAEAVRRLPDPGTEAAVGQGLPPARAGQDQSPSPGGGGASSRPSGGRRDPACGPSRSRAG